VYEIKTCDFIVDMICALDISDSLRQTVIMKQSRCACVLTSISSLFFGNKFFKASTLRFFKYVRWIFMKLCSSYEAVKRYLPFSWHCSILLLP